MIEPISIDPLLIKKYNQAVPRYTSYPTVPFWQSEIDIIKWQDNFSSQFIADNAAKGISIYIHLPFCESLCTYCGCNKKITSNHSVEEQYLDAIEKEWTLYRKLMKQAPVIREIHLGGGTPTFFSAKNLSRLLNAITRNSVIHPDHEFSIEGHPNNTTKEHLDTLYSLGFRRISYGVQDLDPKVQQIINRIQSIENVKSATDNARQSGFTSVNYDLIYGLPLQTKESIEETIRQVVSLRPERIAFYSYAHVPWTSKGQRLFNESDLPTADEKIQLYIKGKSLFSEAGYSDIGMDHFALPGDELYKAKMNGRIHRNFMGYTTQNSGLLLGLGVSAISDTGNAFAQNDKTLHNYYESIGKGQLTIKRGFFLNEEDISFRQYIKDIACNGTTVFKPEHLAILQQFCFPQLAGAVDDGLVVFDIKQLQLTDRGHLFIRNICSAFDLHLQRNNSIPTRMTFSKAI